MEKTLHTVDGSQIRYDVHGHGKPVLFLHGNHADSRYFHHQKEVFAADYQMILMDTRDHGKSVNGSEKLTIDQICEDIKQLITHEKIERVAIVGFSDGANIGLAFAGRYPAQVSQLVIVSPNQRFTDLKTIHQLEFLAAQKLLNGLPFFKKWRRVLDLAMTTVAVTDEELQHISCPVLLMAGSRDIVASSRLVHLGEQITGGTTFFIAEGCGHSFVKQKPELFNHCVRQFLENTLVRDT